MRTLQIGKFFPPENGGIEQVTLNIAEGLANLGVKSDVICFSREKSSEEQHVLYKIYRHKTQTELLSTPISMKFWRHLGKIASTYDLIHLHCPNPWPSIQLLLTPLRVPVVIHWHGDIVRYGKLAAAYRMVENKLLEKSSGIIATSEKYANASSILKPFLKKTTIVPLGIDSKPKTAGWSITEKLQQLHGRKKIVFSLGRLIYYKGFDVLIRAARHLPGDHVVLIGGTGPLKDKLQYQIDQLELNDKVKLLGKLSEDELTAYYAACSVFCLPSIERSEAFGVVLLEAMSAGKPIVATNIPGSGVDWVNQHDVTGINVPPGNELALAAAINKITSSAELATQYSLNARTRMDTLFTREKMATGIFEYYKKILEKTG